MKEKTKCRIKRVKKESWILILAALCVFALAVAKGLEKSVDVSFNPINGDFQHYNMFRRLLDGQVPFKDFFVMLGLGVMYTNSLVLTVIGNTFANGVFSTHFLLVLNGAFIVFALVYMFWRNKTAAALTSLGFALYVTSCDMICRILLPIFPWLEAPWNFFASLIKGVTPLFVPDNASRPLRQVILYVAVLAIVLISSRKERGIGKWFFARTDYVRSIIYGACAGVCFLWANDYGPATYVGMSFLLFLWFAKKWLEKQCSFPKLVLYCLIYIAASILAVVLAVLILTGGDFAAWFSSSFSTAGEVFWYNGIVVTGAKLLTLREIPPFNGAGFYPLLFTVASLLVLLVRWFTCKKKEILQLTHIMVTASMLFVFYFLILKRGYEDEYLNAFRQYAFFGTAWCISKLLSYVAEKFINNKELLVRVITVAVAAVLLIGGFGYSLNVYTWFPAAASPNEAYVEALGGNVTNFHEDIALASEALQGKTLFSTFSTAVEVVNGIYQPSRFEYITFTFGDAAREEYVEAFHESNADYVSIINRDYTRWEGPMAGVKWFFYRELLQNYSFEFNNMYARYLKKTDISSEVDCDFALTVTQLDDGTAELVITTGNTELDIVADVQIAYESSFTADRLKSLAVNKMVTVTGDAAYFFPEENFECWFFPEEHEEWYMPILIENGVGRVVISTVPVECTELNISDVQVLGLYDFEKVFGPNNF